MATTFNDEYQKALIDRGLALSSKRFAVQMKEDAIKRKDDLELILFGDENNYGIVSVISLYYAQIYCGTGKKTSKLELHNFTTAKSQYQSNFALSVTAAGDGQDGLHPPQKDNPASGQDDVNSDSVWLTGYGLEEKASGTGLIQNIQTLLKIIGVKAVKNENDRGVYNNEEAAKLEASKDRGTGILGLRTENSEVFQKGDHQWFIGKNALDSPDDYTLKDQLLAVLKDVINNLDTFISLSSTTLDILKGQKCGIINSFNIELPIQDIPELEKTINQFRSFLHAMQSYHDYFVQYTHPSPKIDREKINEKLEEVKIYVQSMIMAVNTRCDGLPNLMGNTQTGLIKHLSHWVTKLVKKPDGAYSMLLGAEEMIKMTNKDIDKKNENLLFFEKNKNRWIQASSITAIYNRAVFNLDKTIRRFETDILWNLIQSANKYKIISKPFSKVKNSLSNDEWDRAVEVWVTDKTDAGLLKTTLTVSPPTESTIFRVVAFDTEEDDPGHFHRMDVFDTRSKQSDIVSDNLPFIQKENISVMDASGYVSRTAIGFNKETVGLIKEGDFLWLNEAILAQVIGIGEEECMLDSDYGKIASVRKLFGFYYVPPIK